MPDFITGTINGWVGWATAAILGVFTAVTQFRKSKIDESAMVLGKWKELVEQHQQSIKDVRDEFISYKNSAMGELKDMRERLQIAETRIRQLEEENSGLRRAIAQSAKSTAAVLMPTYPGSNSQEDLSVNTSLEEDLVEMLRKLNSVPDSGYKKD